MMKIDNNSAENMMNLTNIDKNRPISTDSELSKDLKLKGQAEEMEAARDSKTSELLRVQLQDT